MYIIIHKVWPVPHFIPPRANAFCPYVCVCAQCGRCNPGLHACWANALPLSSIPSSEQMHCKEKMSILRKNTLTPTWTPPCLSPSGSASQRATALWPYPSFHPSNNVCKTDSTLLYKVILKHPVTILPSLLEEAPLCIFLSWGRKLGVRLIKQLAQVHWVVWVSPRQTSSKD